MNIDPQTGEPLPPAAIQRILFLAPKVHIYQIPPLASTKGYQASSWTANDNAAQIFTARLRIVETCIPTASTSSSETNSQQDQALQQQQQQQATDTEPDDKVTTTLLLEDPSTGALFAAAPYTHELAVQQALDSSRFFAITVVGEGRKAVLGMGFEERSDAFDFSIALQDARRVMRWPSAAAGAGGGRGTTGENAKKTSTPAGGSHNHNNTTTAAPAKLDFRLKEGETISISLGSLKGRRAARPEKNSSDAASPDALHRSEKEALFSIAPPPGSSSTATSSSGGGLGPAAGGTSAVESVKEERRRSRQGVGVGVGLEMQKQRMEDLGFDDGEFGEFQ